MTSSGKNFVEECRNIRQKLVGKRRQEPLPLVDYSLPQLPEGWTWASLSELCERVSVGHVGPTSEYFCDASVGVPFIRSQNVRPGKLDTDGIVYITKEFHRSLKKSQLQSGDILFVRVGANRGDCCVVPERISEINCANIVFARPFFANNFIGLYFRSDFGQKLLLSVTTGAAQGVLNTTSIAALPVPVPPLETQRKIASILSAYDDLIGNNTRRIKNLEEMARMIYREWFVNFRFPGHEQVKMVDSPLGLIPEGWEVKAVQDTFEILGGGTPSTKEPAYWDAGTVNWYSPTDLTSKGTMFMDESATKITQFGLLKSSARLFPVFSVMMTSRATLGVIAINTTEACTNQGFITCIPNERFPLYTLYFWLRENVDQFISLASGATFKEITKGVFKTIELTVPPAEVVCRFEEIVGSIGKQLLNFQRKNQNLRQTRELLLPKLISGEVAVADVGITESAL